MAVIWDFFCVDDIMKIKELIDKLKDFNPNADISTVASEDIKLTYVYCVDGKEYSKKTTQQVFIEPVDACEVCINYDDDYCLIHSKPCDSVKDECMFFDYDW